MTTIARPASAETKWTTKSRSEVKSVTKKLPFTAASVKRAIRAAQESGLPVLGIAPDGTLILDASLAPPTVPADTPPPEEGDWNDLQV